MCATMAKLLDLENAPAWYESDLQLAAALGKKLLENNMELEEAIRMHEATIQKQEYEMQDITKRHAKHLQELNNNHNQMLEQLESIITESETEKETLKLEKLEYTKKNQSLREEVEFWKQQYQTTQDKIEQLVTENSVNQQKHIEVKTLDTNDDDDYKIDTNEKAKNERMLINLRCEEILRDNEDDTMQLQNKIHDLELCYRQEQNRCGILENEMMQISVENQFLEEQLAVLREENQHARTLRSEISEVEPKERECPNCKLKMCYSQYSQESQNEASIEVIRCEYDDKTDIYGSQESLCSADRMSGEMNNNKHKFVKRPSLLNELLNHADVGSVCINNSPVREFAIQCLESVCIDQEETWKVANSSFYTSLFEDYESKNNVTNKCSTTAVQTEDERLVNCELEPLENPFRDRFHKTPEYKSLFQEIYAVLKRKVGGVVMPKKEIIPLEAM